MKNKIVNFTYITTMLIMVTAVLSGLVMAASTGLAVPLDGLTIIELPQSLKIPKIL